MAVMQGIPAPTDSYDHENSTKANMTSIRAMIAVFDASMDSLHATIDHHIDRLDDISKRASDCQKQWKSLCDESGGDKDHNSNSVITITCPSAYEDVIDESKDLQSDLLSALSKAREGANSAIRAVLREEALAMETTAKPSDVWLDRASAFDERIACQNALQMNTVPPLTVGSDNSVKTTSTSTCTSSSTCSNGKMTVFGEEAKYYKDGAVREKIMEGPSSSQLEPPKKRDTTPDTGSGSGDDDMSVMNQSVMSEQTGRGTLYTNYSMLSQGTASHRRRQRKLTAALSRKNANGLAEKTGRSDVGTTSSRQHMMTGSLPYVCEMLHDTHRLGLDGHVFPPVEDVCDLFIYGTSEMAYDLHGSSSHSHKAVAADLSGRSRLLKSSATTPRGNKSKMVRKSSSELFKLPEDEPLSS